MTRIDELLAQLSPSGVEYKPLGNVATISGRNKQPSAMGREAVRVFSLPSFDKGQLPETVLGTEVGSAKTALSGPCVLVAKLNPHIPRVWRLESLPDRSYCSPEFYPIIPMQDLLDLGYLYHFVKSKMMWLSGTVTGSTNSHKRLHRDDFLKLRIPVPPLELQREIVRILDQFTQLEAELEAELEARRRQYEHYRHELFEIKSSVRIVALRDLFDMRSGRFIPASQISPQPNEDKPFPCYGGNGLRGYVANSNQTSDRVLIGRQGALSGNVHRASGCFYATEHAVVVTPLSNQEIDLGWSFHLLTAMNLNQYVSKGAQPGLAVGTLKALEVAVPPITEQKRIASILDSFDTLVNNLTIGLPAELAARRKQYEYYRDRLLTFKEAAA